MSNCWERFRWTAPTNTRVLVCDHTGDVFIAKVAALRWRDEADRLIDRPLWWQSLPESPREEHRQSRSAGARRERDWLREGPGFQPSAATAASVTATLHMSSPVTAIAAIGNG